MLSPSEAPGKPARLVLTPGEPAGIGPDLVVQLNCSEHLSDLQLELIVAADPDLLQARAQLLGKQFQLREFNPADTSPKCGQLQILPVSMDCPCQPGVVEPGNAAYVIKTLETALDGCLDGQFDGLVTGPVHKAVINDAGLPFTGHTEWFADRIDRHIGLAEIRRRQLQIGAVQRRDFARNTDQAQAVCPVRCHLDDQHLFGRPYDICKRRAGCCVLR